MKRVIIFLSLAFLSVAVFADADEYDTIIERLNKIITEAEAAKTEVEALRPDPLPPVPPTPGEIDFAVIAMRFPRSDDTRPTWPSSTHPYEVDPNSILTCIKADGTESVIADHTPEGACMDPQVAFDGSTVFYSVISETPRIHADVWCVDVDAQHNAIESTRRQITQQDESQPNGQMNTGAAPLPGGRLIFTSDWNVPLLNFFGTTRHPRLCAIDQDGSNFEVVGYLNKQGALHPSVMPNGRIMWSSGETFGWRGKEQWGLFHSNPDGNDWGPLWSAFTSHSGLPFPVHFQAAIHVPSDSGVGMGHTEIVVAQYYKQKNFGTGILRMFDPTKGFSSPADLFVPVDAVNITPLSPLKDVAAPKGGPEWNNDYVGKWSHPAAAPGGMLATWTGPSPTNVKAGSATDYLPNPRGTTVFVGNAGVITTLADLTIVSPTGGTSDYIQPVALVPYQDIHGITEPPELPWLPQGQHEMLPVGTPYGIIGTDTVYVRESKTEGSNKPWKAQGSDVAVGYENEDIEFVRILLQELSRDDSNKTVSYGNVSPERLKILADVPINKPSGSFQVRLPADGAFTFQLCDKDHNALTTAQTWRMVRSGEVHRNCRGCHAHWHPSTGLTESQWNALPDPVDLTAAVPKGYDWTDVKPIIEEHCVACHDGTDPDLRNLLHASMGQPWKISHSVAKPFRALDSEIYQRIVSDDPDHRMPKNLPPLSAEDIDTIRKWIDTGCQDKNSNVDDQLPTLHIESPRRRTDPITEVVFGAADSYGINDTLTTVTLDGGPNLFGNHIEDDGVFTLPLPGSVAEGTVTISVTDSNGNTTTQTREFKGN